MSQRGAKEIANLKLDDAVNVWVGGKGITFLQKVSGEGAG